MKKKFLMPIFFFSLAGTALAYNLLQPLPYVGQSVESFPDYITKIIPFILGLAAVLAVVEIVIGGIEYAVTEAIDSKTDAIDRIRQAILGLLLALASWLILSTINPALVNLQLNIPGLPSATQNGVSGTTQQPGKPTIPDSARYDYCVQEGTRYPSTFCSPDESCWYDNAKKTYVCVNSDIDPNSGDGGVQPPTNIVPPSPNTNSVCPPGQNNTACQTGEDCVLDANNGTSYVCFSKTFQRTDAQLEYYCAASQDVGKSLGGSPAQLTACGGRCQGQLCYVRAIGQPLPATGSQPPTSEQPPPNIVSPPSNTSSACPPGQNNTFCDIGLQCQLNFSGTNYICASPLGSAPNSIPKSYCLASTDFCKPYGGCTIANLASCGSSCPAGQTCYTIYESQPK